MLAVNQGVEREAVDEAPDLARSHGLFVQIAKLNGGAAFFEESLGGAGGLGTFDSVYLNGGHSSRRTVMGSTREARRAGAQQAINAIIASKAATEANVSGSVAPTP